MSLEYEPSSKPLQVDLTDEQRALDALHRSRSARPAHVPRPVTKYSHIYIYVFNYIYIYIYIATRSTARGAPAPRTCPAR